MEKLERYVKGDNGEPNFYGLGYQTGIGMWQWCSLNPYHHTSQLAESKLWSLIEEKNKHANTAREQCTLGWHVPKANIVVLKNRLIAKSHHQLCVSCDKYSANKYRASKYSDRRDLWNELSSVKTNSARSSVETSDTIREAIERRRHSNERIGSSTKRTSSVVGEQEVVSII